MLTRAAVRTAPRMVAAVGFTLTVYPVHVERGWLDRVDPGGTVANRKGDSA